MPIYINNYLIYSNSLNEVQKPSGVILMSVDHNGIFEIDVG